MKVLISTSQRRIRLNQRRIKRDSCRALKVLKLERAELGILFVGDKRMRALNLKYRGVGKPTDVLSFPMYNSFREFPPEGEFLLGDIVINPSEVDRRRMKHGLTLNEELRWLIVHGILHLMGYDHERSRHAERKMRRKEAEVLEELRAWSL